MIDPEHLPSRTPPSRLPAARRRRQLLDVAVEVFAERGFHGTSMDEVAEAAGVTKPVLYQHFDSKRELYLELLEDVGSHLVAMVTAAVGRETGPRRRVEAGFRAYFEFVTQQTDAFTLLFGSGDRREEDFSDAVRRVEDAMAAAVAALIEADLSDDHREILGYGIVGLAEVTSRKWASSRKMDELDSIDRKAEAGRLARRVSELAWAGLRGVRRDPEPPGSASPSLGDRALHEPAPTESSRGASLVERPRGEPSLERSPSPVEPELPHS
ncbi:MAG TPA: TetR/AcrR family transcriptional regulator [Acidimicrobiales bacterium]|nr:TetR/AcrR family transcriptional regulator [Acidimicrobiales bacterium]